MDFLWSLRVLPISAWVSSRYLYFVPQSENMQVRLIGESKLSLRAKCGSEWWACPAVDWMELGVIISNLQNLGRNAAQMVRSDCKVMQAVKEMLSPTVASVFLSLFDSHFGPFVVGLKTLHWTHATSVPACQSAQTLLTLAAPAPPPLPCFTYLKSCVKATW